MISKIMETVSNLWDITHPLLAFVPSKSIKIQILTVCLQNLNREFYNIDFDY